MVRAVPLWCCVDKFSHLGPNWFVPISSHYTTRLAHDYYLLCCGSHSHCYFLVSSLFSWGSFSNGNITVGSTDICFCSWMSPPSLFSCIHPLQIWKKKSEGASQILSAIGILRQVMLSFLAL